MNVCACVHVCACMFMYAHMRACMCMSPASPLADAIMPACICFQSRFVVLAPASFSKSAGISAMAIAAAKAGCVPADSQHACCNVKRLGSAVSGPATATSTGTDWWLQPLLKHLEGLATSLHTDLRAIFDEGVNRYGSDCTGADAPYHAMCEMQMHANAPCRGGHRLESPECIWVGGSDEAWRCRVEVS